MNSGKARLGGAIWLKKNRAALAEDHTEIP